MSLPLPSLPPWDVRGSVRTLSTAPTSREGELINPPSAPPLLIRCPHTDFSMSQSTLYGTFVKLIIISCERGVWGWGEGLVWCVFFFFQYYFCLKCEFMSSRSYLSSSFHSPGSGTMLPAFLLWVLQTLGSWRAAGKECGEAGIS